MKDLWFDEYTRLLDEGMDEDRACDLAFANVADRLADAADFQRKYEKENGDGN